MNYDYSKLKGRIKEKCGNQYKFAEYMGLSSVSVSDKLNNKVDFSQENIEKAVEILDIPREEISLYFFAQKVQFK